MSNGREFKRQKIRV